MECYRQKRYRIDRDTLAYVENPQLRAYAAQYVGIQEDLVAQIRALGVDVAERRKSPLREYADSHASDNELAICNDGRSVSRRYLSPACETCRKGVSTRTFFLNTRCNRNCFFCFNPNQEEFAARNDIKHDVVLELDEVVASGEVLDDIALTGGEPLLYPDEVVAFFAHARTLFPHAYLRLYTNGDFADNQVLYALGAAGLDEVRFSVKQDDPTAGYASDPVVARVAAAKRFIPRAMVEMPVLPGDTENMEVLLDELDGNGADGVNLLELCFPFHNWPAYAQRGYRVKNPPLIVPYSYEYAGGLPVDGSEDACLALVDYAQRSDLRMGVHYCSLENKFTSQIYLQNAPYADAVALCILSQRDCFLKSCKLFGRSARRAVRAFEDAGVSRQAYSLIESSSGAYVDFNPSLAFILASALPDEEMAICYRVIEDRDAGLSLRELALDIVALRDFDMIQDI